jgi:hypothetical protein
MHTCSSCRRILSNSSRDALCLKCLYLIDRGRAFDDEPETKPGKSPSWSARDNAGANAAAL